MGLTICLFLPYQSINVLDTAIAGSSRRIYDAESTWHKLGTSLSIAVDRPAPQKDDPSLIEQHTKCHTTPIRRGPYPYEAEPV